MCYYNVGPLVIASLYKSVHLFSVEDYKTLQETIERYVVSRSPLWKPNAIKSIHRDKKYYEMGINLSLNCENPHMKNMNFVLLQIMCN